jgi:uncharacterized coiled-coil protein SlyX
MSGHQLEIKRLLAEFHKVRAAKYEQDFRISERENEIERLRAAMDIQEQNLDKIKEQLRALEVDTDKL